MSVAHHLSGLCQENSDRFRLAVTFNDVRCLVVSFAP